MAKVIGIDIGLTNSRVAVIEENKSLIENYQHKVTTRIISRVQGFPVIPSVVSYTKNGNYLVGQIAKHHGVINQRNTIHSVKHFIGRRYDEVSQKASQVGYQILPASNGGILINCPDIGKQFTPEEISAKVLRKLADAASTYLGEDVTQAVITVPAYFTDEQRIATREAGKLAGLEVLRIINESTAACLAYGLNERNSEIILVVDLGGATLDVCVLEVGDGVFEIFGNSSDLHLGGNHFEQKIIDWLAAQFQHQENIDLRQDKQALQRLTEAAEKAKIELSTLTQTEINLPFICVTKDSPKHICRTITRSQFEEMCSDLLKRCYLIIKQVIQEAKCTIEEINEVVLVGGSSQIPAVGELVNQLTGIAPIQGINPEEAVAVGAAIQANITSSRPDWDSACISWCLTYLSLGVETQDGLITTLIERETFLPVQKSQIFSTEIDGQTSVQVNILQGERPFAKDNKSLGTLRLDGILPAPKGLPQIKVTFSIDCNNILSVIAKDLATEKEVSLVLPYALVIDSQEIEHIRKDAERNAPADNKLIEPINTKKQIRSVIFDAHQELNQLLEKASIADKIWLEKLVKNLQQTIDQQEGCYYLSLPNQRQPALLLASPTIATSLMLNSASNTDFS